MKSTHFKCADCQITAPVQTAGGTGYATLRNGRKVCYACCAVRDRADMEKTGRALLYLTHETERRGPQHADEVRIYYATNWPGTLRIRIGGAARHSRNNFGAQRTDVWFRHAGADWHGVNIGDNQILRCKRTKGK